MGAARSSYNLGQLSNGYYPVSLNKWLDGISGNTVYFGFMMILFSDPLYNASIGSFSFSDEPFGVLSAVQVVARLHLPSLNRPVGILLMVGLVV